MALPIDFKERNVLYGKPEAMTDEQCMTLPVWKGIDEEGFPFCISLWQPSKEDIEAINAGRPIILRITTNQQPPVSIMTLDESGNVN